MLGKQKNRLEELNSKLVSLNWDIAEIKHADIDPDRKDIYISDAEYQIYVIESEIEQVQHKICMYPLQLILIFGIVVMIGMITYALCN